MVMTGSTPMLICLSSGSRPRYRQDVLRSVGLPIGSLLQFRYDSKHVSKAVLAEIKAEKLAGSDAIIVYADQADDSAPDGLIELVPLRLAKVKSASLPGKTVSLVFELGEFAYASDIQVFNKSVSTSSAGALAQRKGGKLTGLYCESVKQPVGGHVSTTNLGDWEELVTQLADRKDFDHEPTFVTVLGLLRDDQLKDMGAMLCHSPWQSTVGADDRRKLVVYHYHPSVAPTNLQIRVTMGPQLSVEGHPVASLDSRYDLKRFAVRSGDPTLGSQPSWIVLLMVEDAKERLDLEISLKVNGNWMRRTLVAVLIAAGITGTQVVPLISRPDLTGGETWPIAGAVFGFSLLVGLAAAWGIRRSL